MKRWTAALILVGAACLGGRATRAEAQLRWPAPPKKVSMRVRLVAVALADPPSTFFSRHEVFVAETEIGREEWSLIKLIFTHLPYQPGLMDTGFDYSMVHQVLAERDPDCDETVDQLTARSLPDRHEPLIYSRHIPKANLDRRTIPLPCYEMNADEYIRSSVEPAGLPAQPIPFLEERSKLKPIPFFEERSRPKAIPFFDDRSDPLPIPFFDERPKPKPIPFLDQPAKPR